MDTWFTQQPLIQAILTKGMDVIGMVKATNQRYSSNTADGKNGLRTSL
ncbi:hypothetical protein NBRC111894_3542 [Sporolactobacillus inulinus]|uniref:Uncharacterized protein n=1 Tax=Sporolactobacillus inulinus TaxID=2078 RepID=A0A4Y1ZHZ5_9BACL|nr:hypothetical protein NBRC111894_3542 [Sporolactobacillus inulinus]